MSWFCQKKTPISIILMHQKGCVKKAIRESFMNVGLRKNNTIFWQPMVSKHYETEI